MKNCSEKFHNIHGKITAKVFFIQKSCQPRPVKKHAIGVFLLVLLNFLENTYQQLLLKVMLHACFVLASFPFVKKLIKIWKNLLSLCKSKQQNYVPAEAALQSYSKKKLFRKYAVNLQENTHVKM